MTTEEKEIVALALTSFIFQAGEKLNLKPSCGGPVTKTDKDLIRADKKTAERVLRTINREIDQEVGNRPEHHPVAE